VGIDKVIALHASLAVQFAESMSRLLHTGFINGLPGFVTLEQDDTMQTTAFQIEDGKIVTIYITRNPDKLRHLNHGSIH
jgi:RNA polymerase sigma-70 factor (ECF subfamily)